ncbi:hypothetical protein BG005_002589 [Podila minutissima]|nr:hypothetical protein BG005_002589 [Podila minutissima]
MLQGLPASCEEDDIRAIILDQGDIGLESVRIARDRQTGISRGFAFIRFLSLQCAQEFMRHWAPSIKIGQNWARLAYSNNPGRDRKQGSGFNGHPDRSNWHSGHSQQQYTTHNPMEHQAPSMNVGARDIGQVPNAMLIVVDLPPLINESHVWNALKLLGPLKRVMMVKDRQSRISWGFCFAEFEDIKSATSALESTISSPLRIQTNPVTMHYAHHGSFMPAYAPTQWTIDFQSESQLAMYWDEQAFLSQYSELTTSTTPTERSVNKDQTTAGKVDELDVFYASMGDVFKSGPTSSNPISSASTLASQPDPIVSTSVLTAPAPELPALPTAAKMDKDQLAGIAAAQAAEQLAKAEEKRKRKAASMISTVGISGGGLKISKQLQKWSTKQVELSGESPTAPTIEEDQKQLSAPLGQTVPQVSTTTTATTEAAPGSYDPDELLDLKLVACLLCQRRLKTVQDLRKHQSLSDLHKKNLQDPVAVTNALKKSRGSGTDAAPTSSTSPAKAPPSQEKSEEEPKYRDRAAERRQIFGQPDFPLPPQNRNLGSHGRGGSGSGSGSSYGRYEDTIIPEQPTKDGIKEDNIGNRLLKSMGWKEGQGLGKDGAGITAPIEASGYSQGVGIGAGLARKPGGVQRGPLSNYAETVKDLARRRYEQSG